MLWSVILVVPVQYHGGYRLRRYSWADERIEKGSRILKWSVTRKAYGFDMKRAHYQTQTGWSFCITLPIYLYFISKLGMFVILYHFVRSLLPKWWSWLWSLYTLSFCRERVIIMRYCDPYSGTKELGSFSIRSKGSWQTLPKGGSSHLPQQDPRPLLTHSSHLKGLPNNP